MSLAHYDLYPFPLTFIVNSLVQSTAIASYIMIQMCQINTNV